ILCLTVCCCKHLAAAAKKFGLTFKSPRELKMFQGMGAKLTIDTKHSTKKGSGSLAIHPGAHVELPLFKKKDGTGTITVQFYDDMTLPADFSTTRRGPSFGLRNKDGYEMSIGIMYASFIKGEEYYYLNHYRFSDKAETPSKWIKHIKVKRVKGWNSFAFEFDARKGLIIKHNDKDINHGLGGNPFKWEETKFTSFDKIIIHGDKKDDNGQVMYIDDLIVNLNQEGSTLKLP
ncbi:MAG: hypothetical protein HRU15_02995, partial [Planctomycetes bacterium]|nr:hypothetical protein [Planctomycetota bacterium]